MLVKHNLSPSYKLDKSNLSVWNNGVELRFEGDIIAINRLKENGITYYPISKFMSNNIEVETPIIVKFILENINGASLYIGTLGLNKHNDGVTSNKIERREVEISGLRSTRPLQLQVQASSDEECRIKIYGIRIITGEKSSDIYLPNIDNLPKEKRRFLPPEGNYKEITPL